jgi:hypothetical protein
MRRRSEARAKGTGERVAIGAGRGFQILCSNRQIGGGVENVARL